MSIVTTSKQFSWFLLVGGISTAFHFLTLWALRELAGMNVVLATTIGYVVGAIANYFLNKRITFSDIAVGIDAMPRFFFVVLTGMALNGLLMALMDFGLPTIPYLLRQCVATAVTLVSNFYLHKQWTFRATKIRETQ